MRAGFLLSSLLFGAGWAAFGAATLRTPAFPGWAVVLLIVGAVVSILPLSDGALVVEVVAAAPASPSWRGGGASELRPPGVGQPVKVVERGTVMQ